MLESVLGSETFLAGLHLYLQRHQYSNAETSDLWSAMTEQVGSVVCVVLVLLLLLPIVRSSVLLQQFSSNVVMTVVN